MKIHLKQIKANNKFHWKNSDFVKTCDELVIGPQCPAWVNNPYALKNHQLLYHNEHYQCSFCKNAWPLNQAEDFKLHMFRQEVIKRGGLDRYFFYENQDKHSS